VKQQFDLTVNGTTHKVVCEPDTPLLWVLRGQLGFVGTKFGCGSGLCGACSVLIDDTAINSCDTPVWSVGTKHVTTIEGLDDHGSMSRFQEEFLNCEAAQCGYCTSGILIRGTALLNKRQPESPSLTRSQACEALEPNLCRCGIHNRAINALMRAGEK